MAQQKTFKISDLSNIPDSNLSQDDLFLVTDISDNGKKIESKSITYGQLQNAIKNETKDEISQELADSVVKDVKDNIDNIVQDQVEQAVKDVKDNIDNVVQDQVESNETIQKLDDMMNNGFILNGGRA